jgi:ribosomal protein L7/L12
VDDKVISSDITALQFKVGALERKLNFVMRYLKLEYKEDEIPAALTEVADWLRKGNKMEAIKVYRQRTGVDMKEAMQAVDAFAKNMGVG